MGAGIVERPCRAHVDYAGRAALEHVGRRGLVDIETGEELGRKQVEVDLAILIRIRQSAVRGHRDIRVVEQDLGEAGSQAANRHVHAVTIDVARELNSGYALQRLRDVQIGKLADVLGKHGVGESDGLAFGGGRILQALAVAGNDDFLQLGRLCTCSPPRPIVSRRIRSLRECRTGTHE